MIFSELGGSHTTFLYSPRSVITSLCLVIWHVDSFQHPFHPCTSFLFCQTTPGNLNSTPLHHGPHIPQESGSLCIAIILWKDLFHGGVHWYKLLIGRDTGLLLPLARGFLFHRNSCRGINRGLSMKIEWMNMEWPCDACSILLDFL